METSWGRDERKGGNIPGLFAPFVPPGLDYWLVMKSRMPGFLGRPGIPMAEHLEQGLRPPPNLGTSHPFL